MQRDLLKVIQSSKLEKSSTQIKNEHRKLKNLMSSHPTLLCKEDSNEIQAIHYYNPTKCKKLSGPQYHNSPKFIGSPQCADDYRLIEFEAINSEYFQYTITGYLGRGTFGQVAIAFQHNKNRYVAMKLLKKQPSYARQGMIEISFLKMFQPTEVFNGNDHLISLLDHFEHQGHICIVFELLSQNLYEFMKSDSFKPVPLFGVRAISFQVLKALIKLSQYGIIHADLKPENIMIVNHQKYPYWVKVIDFGSAVAVSHNRIPCYLQSRYYRAPEVILGCKFGRPIDMWSLGCIMAELVTGWAIFPGSNQYEQIRYICKSVGYPSEEMLISGTKTLNLFEKNETWKLLEADEYTSKTGVRVKKPIKYSIKKLDTIRQMLLKSAKNGDEYFLQVYSTDVDNFMSALKQILRVDHTMRPAPEEAISFHFWNFFYSMSPNIPWFNQSCMDMYSSSAWSNCQASPQFYQIPYYFTTANPVNTNSYIQPNQPPIVFNDYINHDEHYKMVHKPIDQFTSAYSSNYDYYSGNNCRLSNFTSNCYSNLSNDHSWNGEGRQSHLRRYHNYENGITYTSQKPSNEMGLIDSSYLFT